MVNTYGGFAIVRLTENGINCTTQRLAELSEAVGHSFCILSLSLEACHLHLSPHASVWKSCFTWPPSSPRLARLINYTFFERLSSDASCWHWRLSSKVTHRPHPARLSCLPGLRATISANHSHQSVCWFILAGHIAIFCVCCFLNLRISTRCLRFALGLWLSRRTKPKVDAKCRSSRSNNIQSYYRHTQSTINSRRECSCWFCANDTSTTVRLWRPFFGVGVRTTLPVADGEHTNVSTCGFRIGMPVTHSNAQPLVWMAFSFHPLWKHFNIPCAASIISNRNSDVRTWPPAGERAHRNIITIPPSDYIKINTS